MLDSNDGDQEPSAVQHRENDGCPICGASILAVERCGPSDVVVQPCGHEVGDTLARNFPRTEGARTDGGPTARGFVPTPLEDLEPVNRVETADGEVRSFGRHRELTADEWDVDARDEQRTRMREKVAAIREEDHEFVEEIAFEDPDYGPEFHVRVQLVDDCKSTFDLESVLREHGLRTYGVDVYDGHLAVWVHEEGWAEWSE